MCKKKNVLKVLLIAILSAVIIKSAYELKWFDVLLGIYKLETGKAKVQSVSLKSFAFVSKAHDENAFFEFMASKKWQYVRSYGRGMLFEKEGYELLITKNIFFRRYAYYEVTSKAVFEMV